MDKPSLTIRPESTGPKEKKKTSGLSIDVSVATDNLSVKLRAIAKHATALADELEVLDQGIVNELKKEG